LQKNKILVISILAALLVSGALSVAAAQETPQVAPTQPDSIPPSPALQPSRPVEGDQYAPGVGSATITGSDGVTTTVENVTTLPAPIYEKDGVPAFDVDGNGQEITSQTGNDEPIYIAPQPGMGEVTPIYLMGENSADTSGPAAATAVGLVVAALSMGAVGIVCLSKHP
jgi:hypothetical protein